MAINVSGLTIEDILDMDFNDINKLNRKDLSAITSRLVSASNKRIRRLEKSTKGQTSPSLKNLKGKTFSVKGKNTNQLRQEFANAKNFLQNKTSTIQGWEKEKKAIAQRSGFKNVKDSKKFWNVYSNFQRNNPDLVKARGSDRVQEILHQEFENIDDENFMENFLEKVERGYYEEELDEFDEDDEEYEIEDYEEYF